MVNKRFGSLKILIVAMSILFVSACNAELEEKSSGQFSANSFYNNTITNIAGEDFIIEDYNLFKNSKVYMLKSHQSGQMLSIVVKNKNDELVIFDGGRIDDGKYLCEFIKSFGGRVKYWFLTHIHDDHIGAIYEIFNNYKESVYIENLCYNFADFDWYYEKIGNDAGAVNLFTKARDEYIESLNNKNLKLNVYDKVHKNEEFKIEDIKIKVMNDLYKLDDDAVNNSSIAYKVDIEDKKMIILGDMGFEAGKLFYKEYENNNDLQSDIVVMAHHGQSGVDYLVYEKIAPKIALWPTTEYIYNNETGKLQTDHTKEWLKRLGVERNLLSYISNYIIE